MGFYRNVNVKVTRWSATLTGFSFPGDAKTVSRVHTGGDGDLNRTDLADPPPANTSRTGGLNDFPFALTTVTSADGGKAAEHGILHRMDLPAAVADRTGLDGRPRFGPVA